jgi:hypothetical protein
VTVALALPIVFDLDAVEGSSALVSQRKGRTAGDEAGY